MKKIHSLFSGWLAVTVLLAACAPKTPSPQAQIIQAVAATLNAIPTPTSAPIPTPYPTSTPFTLSGLFCEYQFCIGHPPEMAFFDVSAQQNPGSPSAYTQGILAAYSASLFIQLMWQISPGASDPQFLLDLILDPGFDTRGAQMDVQLIRNMNVLYTPITTTASPVLPNGAAAAWICRDRVFAWKIYTADTGSAGPLFNDAINRFVCNQ